MRSAAADNDRRAPEESPDRSGRDSSPSTSPMDRMDESRMDDVSRMAGSGPISDRRCVRRRRCRARKPLYGVARHQLIFLYPAFCQSGSESVAQFRRFSDLWFVCVLHGIIMNVSLVSIALRRACTGHTKKPVPELLK